MKQRQNQHILRQKKDKEDLYYGNNRRGYSSRTKEQQQEAYQEGSSRGYGSWSRGGAKGGALVITNLDSMNTKLEGITEEVKEDIEVIKDLMCSTKILQTKQESLVDV